MKQVRTAFALAALGTLLTTVAAAQGTGFDACYVPQVGALYLIKRAGLPQACLAPAHTEISWTPGAGSGSVTSITAGTGLTGGTITTSGTMAVDLAGTGTAITVARSDHTHAKVGGTGVGGNTLRDNTTGTQNTAVGNNALASNTTGGSNTAVGAGAMDGSTTGAWNTAVGAFSLRVASGNGNTAVGVGTLTVTNTGHDNTAVGDSALVHNRGGLENTAVGAGGLAANIAGNQNTAVGRNALVNATGSGNIAIGFNAGLIVGTGNSNIHVGNAGIVGDNEVIRIGGAQTQTFIQGISGSTSSSGVAVLINSSGKLGTTTSSARAKEEVLDLGAASRRLFELRPVQFRYKPEYDDGSRLVQYGLIAEEVAAVFPELAQYGPDGRIETVRYHLLPALLLNELQRQQTELESLRRDLAALRAELAGRR